MPNSDQTEDTIPRQPDADYSQFYGWGGLAVATLIFLGASWNTGLHHLAVGLLIAFVVLLVLLALFEGIWRFVIHALRRLGIEIES